MQKNLYIILRARKRIIENQNKNAPRQVLLRFCIRVSFIRAVAARKKN